jgi:pimeloyl-ACP methyl ester carboxylesterase
MPYFEGTEGIRLHYRDWGDGEPVVFLASWSLSSVMWQYQMVALADGGLRCVAYDRRGHGRSDDLGHGYDYDTLADDLAALLTTLDLDRVTLVAHSMASGEVVRYLTRHGDDRVARIALVSPIGPFPLRQDDNPNGVDLAIFEAVWESWRRDITAWVDAGADGYVGKGLPDCEVSAELVEWTKRDLLKTSLIAQIECQRAAATTDLRPELATITVPALVIHGDHDESIPAEISGCVCAELIPSATFSLYENAPHGLYLTHRDRLTRDLLEFIEA